MKEHQEIQLQKSQLKRLAFVKNSFLGLVLTFEKGTNCNIFTIFKKPCSSAMFTIHFDKPFKKKLSLLHKHIMHHSASIISSLSLTLCLFYKGQSISQLASTTLEQIIKREWI